MLVLLVIFIVFSGKTLIAGYLGMTAGGLFLYYKNFQLVQKTRLEMSSMSLAIYPMLLAEQDREYLKQLRRNRDEERELMKNVEGWKVGTWYGEPIYHTVKKDDPLFEPTFQEYYVHAPFKDFKKRGLLSLYS